MIYSVSCLATDTILDCSSNSDIFELSNMVYLKLLQRTRYLGERIEESLEILNVFSVSIYNGHVYLHYRLHKHAVTPSLIQLYYL